jgi:hypothetical protein
LEKHENKGIYDNSVVIPRISLPLIVHGRQDSDFCLTPLPIHDSVGSTYIKYRDKCPKALVEDVKKHDHNVELDMKDKVGILREPCYLVTC